MLDYNICSKYIVFKKRIMNNLKQWPVITYYKLLISIQHRYCIKDQDINIKYVFSLSMHISQSEKTRLL